MLLLLLFLFLAVSGSPHIDCFVDNQECKISANNLIHTFLGISSIEECRLLCEDEVTCIAFTHFGSNNHPIPDSCLLFSSCRERTPCENCTTGSSQTECTCSITYAGDVTPDNFVNLIGSVPDELACKKLCITDSRCNLYTFYDSQDPVQPETCFLLTSSGLREAVEPCENCFTGPRHCKVNQTCQAAAITNGTVTNVVFAEQNSKVTLVANEKDCFVDLDVVAVGGGGNYVSNSARGACSGYVEAARIRFSTNTPVMEVTVGSYASSGPSKVEVGGEVLLEAARGEDPTNDQGGNGYSGGGGRGGTNGSPRGGSDGGDGEDGSTSAGGRGSGIDIGLLGSEHFSLIPGEGGKAMDDGHGGGGG